MDDVPIKNLNQQILQILAFYHSASAEDRVKFEAEIKERVAAVDDRSKTMFETIIADAKIGKTLEQTIADLEKLA
jgi:hypothetical protein